MEGAMKDLLGKNCHLFCEQCSLFTTHLRRAGMWLFHFTTRLTSPELGHNRHSINIHEISQSSLTNRSMPCWISCNVCCKHNGRLCMINWQLTMEFLSAERKSLSAFPPDCYGCYWSWGGADSGTRQGALVNASLHAGHLLRFLCVPSCVLHFSC